MIALGHPCRIDKTKEKGTPFSFLVLSAMRCAYCLGMDKGRPQIYKQLWSAGAGFKSTGGMESFHRLEIKPEDLGGLIDDQSA